MILCAGVTLILALDNCATSLLSAAWMCRYCGWETCDDCYQSTSMNAPAVDPINKVSPLHVCVSSSLCPRKRKKKKAMQKQATAVSEDGASAVCTTDFLPISRFLPGEPENLIKTIKSLPEPSTAPVYVPCDSIAAAISQADSLRETIRIPSREMSNELLDHLWSPEDPYPFVVTDVTRDLQYKFSPEFFREHDALGKQKCTIQNCQTGVEYESTVAEFFSRYGNESEDRQPERLKVNLSIERWSSMFSITALGLATFIALQDHVPLFASASRDRENSSCEGLYDD